MVKKDAYKDWLYSGSDSIFAPPNPCPNYERCKGYTTKNVFSAHNCMQCDRCIYAVTALRDGDGYFLTKGPFHYSSYVGGVQPMAWLGRESTYPEALDYFTRILNLRAFW